MKQKKTTSAARAATPPGPGPLLCEVAWEVCNQIGGIYTVLRSKAPAMTERWGSRYLLVGPYEPSSALEFEEMPAEGLVASVIEALAQEGIAAHYGRWLITGQPRVLLLDRRSIWNRLGFVKYLFWEHHQISLPGQDELLDNVVAFGHVVEWFFRLLTTSPLLDGPVIGHFHEWMAGTAIPELRWSKLPVSIVFTTHATTLGRWLATQRTDFYSHMTSDWLGESRRMNLEPQVRLERAAAHGSHVFSTVSDVTAYECEHLLSRRPDVLLPNGLNIERFVAVHELQNLHRRYKERINQFVIGHFFPAYSFDLDSTLYFFSSGRYEFRNKGFDLTIDALADLNARLKAAGSDRTIVFFLMSKRPFRSVNPEILQTQAQMREIHQTCEAATQQLAERLFLATASGETPCLDDLVDEFWRMRLRRLRQSWRVQRLPAIVTHDIYDDNHDEVLSHLRRRDLINRREDPVKVVYHPDFLTATTPLLGLDYDQFVRGCHLGIFPSAYEPWGYAPEECVACGVPAVTSDLSGFGTYLTANIPDYDARGLEVVHRRYKSYGEAVQELTEYLWDFTLFNRRGRIDMRNRVEGTSDQFDWKKLIVHYEEAYDLVCKRTALC